MLDAGRDAIRYISAVARQDLAVDDMRARAVVQAIGVIGEAASKLSPELHARYPDVPWSTIIGMRHRLVHGYYEIDYLRVWDTATDYLPPLLIRIEEIVAAETARAHQTPPEN
jgi:uncharacterized protein with HEPN domain